MEKKALSGSCTRALGRSAHRHVDHVSGPEVRVIHSLLIPVLVYTGRIVAAGLVSAITFRRSFTFSVVCTVVQSASGFSERRGLPDSKVSHSGSTSSIILIFIQNICQVHTAAGSRP